MADLSIPDGDKRCTKCGKVKPVADFPICRGRPRSRCRPCHVDDARDYYERNREKRREYLQRHYREKNPDKRPQVAAPEHVRKARRRAARAKWLKDNQEKMDAARQAWAKRNPHKQQARTRKYQAAKRNAAVAWADQCAIDALYAEAVRLTEQTGVPHEVDHIVPLTSNIVCGLHCEANLRVVPRRVNRSKGNKLVGEMTFRGEVICV